MSEPQDLRGPILLAALALLALDALVVFWLAGGIARMLRGRGRPATATIAVALLGAGILGAAISSAPSAWAQNTPPQLGPRGPAGQPGAPAPAKDNATTAGPRDISRLAFATDVPPRNVRTAHVVRAEGALPSG